MKTLKKKITIKVTKDDAIYQISYLEGKETSDPADDRIIPLIFENVSGVDVMELSLEKGHVYQFSFAAMGKASSKITIEIPEIKFKKEYIFPSDRKQLDMLVLAIY